jgi:hypothetical protein
MVDHAFIDNLFMDNPFVHEPTMPKSIFADKKPMPKPKPKPKMPKEHIHPRFRSNFKRVVEHLQRFAQEHFLFVSSKSHPNAKSKARIVSFSVNHDISHPQAISIHVLPPSDIARHIGSIYVELSTYMKMVLHGKVTYDDVLCTIHWNRNSKDATDMLLSTFLPTRVIMADFDLHSKQRGSLVDYKTYLQSLFVHYHMNDFVWDPPMRPSIVDIEIIEDEPPNVIEQPKIIEVVGIPMLAHTPLVPTLSLTQPMDVIANGDDRKCMVTEDSKEQISVCTTVNQEINQETTKTTNHKRKRHEPLLLASRRVLRPRCLKRQRVDL